MRKSRFTALIALTLALLMALGSASAAVTPAGQFPVVDEPVTITIAMPEAVQRPDFETNWFTQQAEALTGIDFVLEEYTSADAATVLNMMFASGDLPDIVCGPSFSKSQINEYADAGLILDLAPYLEEYAPNISAIFDKYSYVNLRKLVQSPDGGIYSVPQVSADRNNRFDIRSYIYEPFLEALGMEMPQTMEEFLAYSRAVATQDPNGNGKNDEIAISGSADSMFWLQFLGNAFQPTDIEHLVTVKDGVLDFCMDNEAYKKALEYLAGMYAEGLIDPGMFTQNVNDLMATCMADEALVGAVIFPWRGSFVDQSVDRGRKYLMMDPLEGPEGVRVTRDKQIYSNFCFLVSAQTEHPEAVVRFLDYLVSEEGSMAYRLGGEKGVDWDVADEGAKTAWGADAIYKVHYDLWVNSTPDNKIWHQNIIGDLTLDDYRQADEPIDTYVFSNNAKIAFTRSHIPAASDEFIFFSLPIADELTYRFDEIQPALKAYVYESAVAFITGARTFDTWDAYVAELDKLHVAEYTEIYQKSYDAYYAE